MCLTDKIFFIGDRGGEEGRKSGKKKADVEYIFIYLYISLELDGLHQSFRSFPHDRGLGDLGVVVVSDATLLQHVLLASPCPPQAARHSVTAVHLHQVPPERRSVSALDGYCIWTR